MISDTLQKKIESCFQNNILGNTIFSDLELNIMNSETQYYLKLYSSEHGGINIPNNIEDIILITIINFTKNNGGNSLINSICEFFVGEYSVKLYNRLMDLIKNTYNRHGYIYFDGKYYSTIQFHALSPIKSLESFFDLCWNIFCKDLCTKYIPGDNIFSMIVKSLSSIFINQKNSDESIKLGSDVYDLKSGLKNLTLNNPNKMILLIEDIMKKFDLVYNNDSEIVINNYLDKIFSTWWIKKEYNLGKENIKENYGGNEYVAVDYTHINPQYIIDKGICYLKIPSFRLSDNLDKKPNLKIYIDNNLVLFVDLEIIGSGLAMKTNSKEINLENLFKKNINLDDINLKVEITHNDKKIYDSKKTLYRKYILFDVKKEINKKYCTIGGNYTLFCIDIGKFAFIPNQTKYLRKFVYNIYPEANESLHYKDKKIFFGNFKFSPPWIEGERLTQIQYHENNNKYMIYKSVEALRFSKTEYNIRQYGIKINNILCPITYFDIIEDDDEYIIKLDNVFEKSIPTEFNLFLLENNKKIFERKLIIFENLKYNFDKEFYFANNNKGILNFKTSLYNDKIHFDSKLQDRVYYNCYNGKISVKIPKIEWKIDNFKWHNDILPDAVWYKNIHNNSLLLLKNPENLKINLKLNDKEIHFHKSKYLLGKSIDNKKTTKIIKLDLSVNDEKFRLANIYFKPTFLKKPKITLQDQIMICDFENNFIGDKYNQFIIIIKKGFKNLNFEMNCLYKEFVLPNLNGIFDITVNLKKDNLFIKNETIELYHCKKLIGKVNIPETIEDERLIPIIKEILQLEANGIPVSDKIKRLRNEEIYNILPKNLQEKYSFDLSKRYKTLKKKILETQAVISAIKETE